MFQKIKQLFTDIFAFAFVTVGNKIISFLLVPIFTRLLDPELFGVWDNTNAITMLLTYICILGTDAAFAFYFFDARNDEDQKSYFSTTVYYSVGVAIVLLGGISLIAEPFSSLVYNDKSYSKLTILAFVSTIEAIFIQHLLALARYKRRIWTFNTLSIGYWVGSCLLNVWFVMKGLGVEGILWGQIIAGGTVSIILLIIFHEEFTLRVKKEYLLNLLRYGAPMVPSLISFWIMNGVSRIIIFHLSSPAEAGIYGAAIRFASFIVLLTSTFQLAWRPFSMSIKDREDAPLTFSIIGRFLIVVGTLAILGLTFFIKPIMLLMTGEKFYTSYPIIWMLSLGTLLHTIYLIFSVGLLIKKDTKAISKAFLIGTLLYMVLNVLFVPMFSYKATAVVSLLTYLFIAYYVYFKGQKVFKIPFRIGSITSYLGIYLVCMSLITYLQINNIPNLWVYYILITGVVVLSIFFTKIFSSQAISILYQQVKELLNKKRIPKRH